jgi:flagellar M-ring protein FliF
MESQANSLINPDARTGLSGASAAAAGATPGAPDFGLGGLSGLAGRIPGLARMRGNPRLPLILASAAMVAIMAAVILWSRTPDYRVLYSNLSDNDGGAIITALQQANVPYKFSDSSGAILVPAEQVHEVRLRLAAQGLPKGGSVGFELMDSQKFGISEFAEQVNYQRALEGELERTIEAINAVHVARVHLAIPKPSVFVREQEAPSASVLLELYPGRALDEGQVQAIARMVASGVPGMPAKNVSIVDQDGNLLTQTDNAAGLDAGQLKYKRQVELDTQKRIDAILAPLFGAGNAHSQVNADIDFSQVEQTSESYSPNAANGQPQQAAIRSQQSSTSTELAQGGAAGVPGALSNTPPQAASAPLTASAATGASAAGGSTPLNDHRDSTTNYELDKTVRHVEQPMGSIHRLSAAIIVNYLPHVDAKGKTTQQPLSAAQLAQVEQLVKDAMGFDANRGDTVAVMNSSFSASADPLANLPWYRQPDIQALLLPAAKWLGIGVLALVLWLMLVRPAMKRERLRRAALAATAPAAGGGLLEGAGHHNAARLGAATEQALLAHEGEKNRYERNLDFARTVAREDPKVVAMVVKNWVSDER